MIKTLHALTTLLLLAGCAHPTNREDEFLRLWKSSKDRGMQGDYSSAIALMKQTMSKQEEPLEGFLWNSYVRANIAFFERDKAKLIHEREALSKGLHPANQANLRTVDAMIRCFDRPYKDSFSAECRPKESGGKPIACGNP